MDKLEGLDTREEIATPGELYAQVGTLTQRISEVIKECVLKAGPTPYKKRWWSPLLTERCRELRRLAHRAYNRRSEPGDPVHHEHRAMRRAYRVLIDNTKKSNWEGFLASLDERLIWTANCYASGDPMDGGQTKIPLLRGGQTSTAQHWSQG